MSPGIEIRQDFRENVKLALDTLRTHKLRSFLTVLGVVIGVGVIIIVASLLVGFDRSVQDQIMSYGADTAFISKFGSGIHFGRLTREERMRKPLVAEDGWAIQEQCSAVRAVAISLFPDSGDNKIRYKDNDVVGLDYRGTFPSFVNVYANASLREGRFFVDAENHHRQNVVVIGQSVAEVLFPNVSPIDKDVLVNGAVFRVIGVFEKPKGGFGDSDEDKRVVVPYETFRKINPTAKEHGIRMQARPGLLDVAVDQARDLLRRRRNVPYSAQDNFGIETSQQIVDQFHDIVGMIALITIVLSSIGLLVGGVGVMNIMLVSVTERTREIGVRKAIGARRRDITAQFLTEAVALTGMGGALGVLFGGGIAQVVRMTTPMQTAVPLWAVLVGLAVSAGVGLIFGVWPAMKASRLDPVEALRYE
ncbi:MAG TPA: ABC transporter permease [Candidatus Acidoferrales bacterium]|nr:ABC transporter permease [Candidatus Acidoferrales bacterium]